MGTTHRYQPTMAERLTVPLPDGTESWIEISNDCKEAIVSYLTDNPDLTMAEASREVIGVDITQARQASDEE